MNFQKVVIIIALLLLVVLLYIIGTSIRKMKKNVKWPPMVADCPDYWIDLSGNGEQCFNQKRLGKCNLPSSANVGGVMGEASPKNKNTKNFNVYPFNDPSIGACAKYNWAKRCGVAWDGLEVCDKMTLSELTTTETTE